jgi:hypothetical protein
VEQDQTDADADERYAKCVEVSKRLRWDIDRDVIRGRAVDFGRTFLPDALSHADRLACLSEPERRLFGQVQGRTYANTLGVLERYIGAKTIELARGHALGTQIAFEALVRFTDEELKHQELFRRVALLVAAGMPPGYRFEANANEVAAFVLGRSAWAVLGLTCHIENFTQAHYREAIAQDGELSDVFKDVFFFHWKEESQHVVVDELEWRREDAKLGPAERDRGVDDLVALFTAVDRMVQAQARIDAGYFAQICGRKLRSDERDDVERVLAGAYRWQYIDSGLRERRFTDALGALITKEQGRRLEAALSRLTQ